MTERTTKKKNRIVIIDDHPLFREGFKAIVDRDSRFEVVGAAGTGAEGFWMVETLRPDVVVMEISLPDRDALQLIRDIRGLFPDISVLILSAYCEGEYISRALQAGATGYAVKGNDSDTLFNGLETVLKGDYFLGSAVLPELFMEQLEASHENKEDMDLSIGRLTPREQEVMRLMAEGVPRKEIARRLSISPKTVENHAWKIMKKLSLNNNYELVRHAAKLGLIDVDLWKMNVAV